MTSGAEPTAEERSALDHVPWVGFVFVAGRSDKFWRVRSMGRFVETWWGRRGASGQRMTHAFHTAGLALAYREAKADEKARKGYVREAAAHRAAAARAAATGAEAARFARQGPKPPAGAVALGRFSALSPSPVDDDD